MDILCEEFASLRVEAPDPSNARRSTPTAMNVGEEEGATHMAPLLEKARPDSRESPPSLFAEHQIVARLGVTDLEAFVSVLGKAIVRVVL